MNKGLLSKTILYAIGVSFEVFFCLQVQAKEIPKCVSLIKIYGDSIDQRSCTHVQYSMKNCSDVKCVISFQTWNGESYTDEEYHVEKTSCDKKSHYRWLTIGVSFPTTLKSHQDVMSEALSEANQFLKKLKKYLCQ